MQTPIVTVLIATYNRSHLLKNAIQSVIDQSYSEWELLLVCDSDSDGTRAVAEAWMKQDRRIVYHEIPRVGRIGPVSNYGLASARGKYVAILDDDDWWADKDKLSKQVRFLDEHLEYVGCGGGYIVVNENGVEQKRILKPQTDIAIRRNALVANPMANSTALFRRDVAAGVHNYDESLREFADWDFWLKMGLSGKLYNFPEYFLYYRMWPGGASFARQRGAAEAALVIVRRYRGKYPRFGHAMLSAYTYNLYARLPDSVKRVLNVPMSLLKKLIFSQP
jgi:glycosyltransferase involved in cell wall biosynthesis